MTTVAYSKGQLNRIVKGEQKSVENMITILEQLTEQQSQTTQQFTQILEQMTNVIQTITRIEAADIELIRDENGRPVGARKNLEGI